MSLQYLGKALVFQGENDLNAWQRGEFIDKFMIEMGEERRIFYQTPDFFLPLSSVKVLNEGRYDDEDHVVHLEGGDVFDDFDSLAESVVPERYVQQAKELWEDGVVEQAVIHLTNDFEFFSQVE
jgi:hypothetical protein